MFKYVLPALAGVMLASAAIPAYAADIIIEEPVYEPKYVEPKAFGGWYLRGHIGMSNQRLGSLYNVLFDTTPDLVIVDKNFEAGVVGEVSQDKRQLGAEVLVKGLARNVRDCNPTV